MAIVGGAYPKSRFYVNGSRGKAVVQPDNDRVIIALPCFGHGFKHSAAIGEALAEQVIDGESR